MNTKGEIQVKFNLAVQWERQERSHEANLQRVVVAVNNGQYNAAEATFTTVEELDHLISVLAIARNQTFPE